MVKSISLSKFGVDAVTVWHSSDMFVYWTPGFWWEADKLLTLIPSKLFGLVGLAAHDASSTIADPLKGFVLMRPCGLEVLYPIKMHVTVQSASTIWMQDWAKNSKHWSTIRWHAR